MDEASIKMLCDAIRAAPSEGVAFATLREAIREMQARAIALIDKQDIGVQQCTAQLREAQAELERLLPTRLAVAGQFSPAVVGADRAFLDQLVRRLAGEVLKHAILRDDGGLVVRTVEASIWLPLRFIAEDRARQAPPEPPPTLTLVKP